jgi:nucleoside-diphosphate-sugar epimerase
VRKFIAAREQRRPFVVAWGTGRASREFLYVEDAARAIALATERYDGSDPVNLGSGREISIADLAHTIARHCGYTGEIRWDATQPDGQPRRMLDTTVARERFGFEAMTGFDEGLQRTIAWYVAGERSTAPPASHRAPLDAREMAPGDQDRRAA